MVAQVAGTQALVSCEELWCVLCFAVLFFLMGDKVYGIVLSWLTERCLSIYRLANP